MQGRGRGGNALLQRQAAGIGALGALRQLGAFGAQTGDRALGRGALPGAQPRRASDSGDRIVLEDPTEQPVELGRQLRQPHGSARDLGAQLGGGFDQGVAMRLGRCHGGLRGEQFR